MGKELGHFVDYLDRSTLESGVKDGSLVVGKLEISRFSDDVAFLRNPLFGGQVVRHLPRSFGALPSLPQQVHCDIELCTAQILGVHCTIRCARKHTMKRAWIYHHFESFFRLS